MALSMVLPRKQAELIISNTGKTIQGQRCILLVPVVYHWEYLVGIGSRDVAEIVQENPKSPFCNHL